MKNFLNLSAAIVAALSMSSCDFPGCSPESVAKDYAQGICDFDADAVFNKAAIRDDIDKDLKNEAKEALQKLLDEEKSNNSYPYSIKGSRLVKKEDDRATVVVYYQTRGYDNDSTEVHLVSEGKFLKKWYVDDSLIDQAFRYTIDKKKESTFDNDLENSCNDLSEDSSF